MKVVTTNLLNRFWKNGVKPIMREALKKVDASKIVKSANITEEGFLMDGKTASELFDELNSKFAEIIKSEDFNGTTDSTSNIQIADIKSKRLYIGAEPYINARILIPFRYYQGCWHIRVLSNKGDAVPNTAISGKAWYIDLNNANM